jgi:chemotaxis protein CheY-P-specific phosphatase CheC
MKAQQKIDRILEAVTKKIQQEVTALIGAVLTLSESENTLISKEDFFEQPIGKQIVAKLEISGSVEGAACLLVGIKDAIRLGGTLIMLPLQELEKVIVSEDYNEETKDSYGEIANIIAGSYTKVFEEMYPEPCRFIRKEQEILTPSKVRIESGEPVPNQLLYCVSSSMKLDDIEMGNLQVLLPAAAFGLSNKEEKTPAEEKPKQQERTQGIDDLSSTDAKAAAQETGAQEERQSVPAFDFKKHKKRVDALLADCQEKMQQEISALLAVDVQLSEIENRPVAKEDFFLNEVAGKQVLAHMQVTGEVEDHSYLFIGVKDAIRIGGTMIMLPPFELDTAVSEEEFSEDTADAYGEIANIIAGVYTAVFEEQYIKKLRFVKTELEQVVPLKVDTASEKPLPNQTYYMSCSALMVDEKALGKLQMLFPVSLFQLEGLQEEPEPEVANSRSGPAISVKKDTARTSSLPAGEDAENRGIDILLVSDDEEEATKIKGVLEQRDFLVKILSFKQNVNDYATGDLKAVILVMHEVDEQAFGVAIKISSSCTAPLVAAGPAWTRSKVIKAVKYGVQDILLTPASKQDVEEKIDNNMVKLAA